jgi:hypothetical protein
MVKIKYNNSISSGFIFLPNKKSDIVYVLASRHPFTKDNKPLSELNMFTSNDIEFTFYPNLNPTVISYKHFLDTNYDLIVFVFDRQENISYSEIFILDGDYEDCYFKGFPNCLNGDEAQFIRATYLTLLLDKINVEIKPNQSLDSYLSSGKDNALGFSGSGVVTNKSDELLLVGIVSEYVSNFNNIKCLSLPDVISNINEKLIGENLPKLKLKYGRSHENEASAETYILNPLQNDLLHKYIADELSHFKEKLSKYSFSDKDKIPEYLEKVKPDEIFFFLDTNEQRDILTIEFDYYIYKLNISKAEDVLNQMIRIGLKFDRKFFEAKVLYIKNDYDNALLKLDTSGVRGKNLKAGILIERNQLDEAEQVLNEIEDRTYDTYRLMAIINLYKGSMSLAFDNITESLKLNNGFYLSNLLKGIIEFYQGIELRSVEQNLLPPLNINSMCVVDYSKIVSANEIFKKQYYEIHNNEQLNLWYLTTLYLVDLKKHKALLNDLLLKNPKDIIAIQVIIHHHVDINIEETLLEMFKSHDLTLTECHVVLDAFLTNGDIDKYKSLWERYKDDIRDHDEALADEHELNILVNSGKLNDAISFIDSSNIINKRLRKVSIYKHQNDFDSAITIYKELFDETSDFIYLFEICSINAFLNNWEFIISKEALLLENPSERVLELLVLAYYNTANYDKCLNFISEYKDNTQILESKFLRIKASCLNAKGDLLAAISLQNEIKYKYNTVEDNIQLAHLYNKAGYLENVSVIADEIISDKRATTHQKLPFLSILPDTEIKDSILNEVDVDEIEAENLSSIMPDLILSKRVSDDVKRKAIDKLVDTGFAVLVDVSQFLDAPNNENTYTSYKNGKSPIHKISKELITNFLSNSVITEYYTNSAKRVVPNVINNIHNCDLILDITSLYMSYSLELTEYIIQSFHKVFIPFNVLDIIEWLDVDTLKDFKNLLKLKIDNGELHFTPKVFLNEINDSMPILDAAIKSIMNFEPRLETYYCVDDRWINNNYNTDNNLSIISSIDLTYSLRKANIITECHFDEIVFNFRKRNYKYIIIRKDEFKKYLYDSDGKYVENFDGLNQILQSYFDSIVNYKCLLPMTQEEQDNHLFSEVNYVFEQQKEIVNLILDIWKEVKDTEMKIKLSNYVFNNMLCLNSLILISNLIEYDKLKHLISLQFSIFVNHSLMLSNIMVRNEYNSWFKEVSRNFLNYNNYIITDNIDLICNIVDSKDELSYLPDAHYENISPSLWLIQYLPEHYVEAVLYDKRFIEAFQIVNVVNLGEHKLSFKRLCDIVILFYRFSGDVCFNLNESETAFLSFDSKVASLYISYNSERFLLPDEFNVLNHNSRTRKQFLKNKQNIMLDDNKSRCKSYINKINNINDPYRRFFELYKTSSYSGVKFYESIINMLNKAEFNVNCIIPKRINTIYGHYRLEEFFHLSSITFKELKEEGNDFASIEKILNFPIELPIKTQRHVKAYFDKISTVDLKIIIRKTYSPICYTNIAKFLFSSNDKLKIKIAKILIKKLIKEDTLKHIRAFFSVLRFVYTELLKIVDNSDSCDVILATWLHSSKSYQILMQFITTPESIEKQFKLSVKHSADVIFNLDKKEHADPMSPYMQDEKRFVLILMSNIFRNNTDLDFLREISDVAHEIFLTTVEDNTYTHYDLYKLSNDKSIVAASWFNYINSEVSTRLTKTDFSLDKIKYDSSDKIEVGDLIILNHIYGYSKIPKLSMQNLSPIIENFIKKDKLGTLDYINFSIAIKQLVYHSYETLLDRVEEYLIYYCSKEDVKTDIEYIFDLFFSISICKYVNAQERIKYLLKMINKIENLYVSEQIFNIIDYLSKESSIDFQRDFIEDIFTIKNSYYCSKINK